jgi:type I restriction enzyme M protein
MMPAALMIFDKSRKPNGKSKIIFQDIDKIVDTFQKRKTIDKYSYHSDYAKIEENEFNLNIPRYVDTFELEEEIDITPVQQ